MSPQGQHSGPAQAGSVSGATSNGGQRATQSDEIVISGLSGRYPFSRSWDEFSAHLYAGDDLNVPNTLRYPVGLYGLPERSSPLVESERFDADFFGFPHNDPVRVMQIELGKRKFLETAHEALCDAGLDLDRDGLRGSDRVGIWSGVVDVNDDLSGIEEAVDPRRGPFPLVPNRTNFLSAAWDLRGPSVEVDSACSSSFTAFYEAFCAMKSGVVDVALVAGLNLTTNPLVNHLFDALGLYSPDGKCKVWDKRANGYVKAEAVVTVILQRITPSLPAPKRIYARVVNVATNTDGYKQEGILFPRRDQQVELMRRTCAEVGIDPCEVKYLEAHGTGTAAGDKVEGNSIVDAYCPDRRKEPLVVSAVKSCMGHAEGASGVAGLSKVIKVLETGIIPPDQNFVEPNPLVTGLLEGKWRNVTTCTPLPSDTRYVGLNSFGFGGVNVHILLEPPTPVPVCGLKDTPGGGSTLPRLICVPGRLEEHVERVMRQMVDNQHEGYLSDHFVKILTDHCMSPSSVKKMTARGWMVLPGPGSGPFSGSPSRDTMIKPLVHNVRSVLPNTLLVYYAGSLKGAEMADIEQVLSLIPHLAPAYRKLLSDAKLSQSSTIGLILQLALLDFCSTLSLKPQKVITDGSRQGNLLQDYLTGRASRAELLAITLRESKDLSCGATNTLREGLPEGSVTVLNFTNLIPEGFPKGTDVINLMSQCKDLQTRLLATVGELYCTGLQVDLTSLPAYRTTNYPVPRGTPNLSSLVANLWDHRVSHPFASYPEYFTIVENAGHATYPIDASGPEWNFLYGHKVDGRPLFPATGYIWVVVHTLAKARGISPLSELRAELWDVSLFRATLLPTQEEADRKGTKSGSQEICFTVKSNRDTHEFSIQESGQVIVTGKVKVFGKSDPTPAGFMEHAYLLNDPVYQPRADEEETKLKTSEVYRELRVRGYDYGKTFQGINWVTADGRCAELAAGKHWIAWADALLQMSILGAGMETGRCFGLPTRVKRMQIDLKPYFKPIEERFARELEAAKRVDDPKSKPLFLKLYDDEDDLVEEEEVKSRKADGDGQKDGKEAEKRDEEHTIRACCDATLNIIVAPGCQIEGVKATPTARRLPPPVLLESHSFIPNIETAPVEWPSTTAAKISRYVSILEEITLMIGSSRDLSSEWIEGLQKKLKDANIQPAETCLADAALAWCRFQLPSAKSGDAPDGSGKEDDEVLSWETIKTDLELCLSRDLLRSASCTTEITFRPLIDLMAENFVPKSKLKIVELLIGGGTSSSSSSVWPIARDTTRLLDSAGFESRDYTVCLSSTGLAVKLKDEIKKDLESVAGIKLYDSLVNLADKDQLKLMIEGTQVVVLSFGTVPPFGDDLNLDLLMSTIKAESARGSFVLINERMRLTSIEEDLLRLTGLSAEPNQLNKTEDFLTPSKAWLSPVAERQDRLGNRLRLYRNIVHQLDENDNFLKLNIIEIPVDQDEDFEWVPQLKTILCPKKNAEENDQLMEVDDEEDLLPEKDVRPVWLVSKSASKSGLLGLVTCLRREPGGERIRCLALESSGIPFDGKTKESIQRLDLVVNVVREGQLGTYRHLTVTAVEDQDQPNIDSDMVVVAQQGQTRSGLIPCEAAFLNTAVRGDLSSFMWYESDLNSKLGKKKTREVVEVHYAALNFRDVMMATGRLPPDCVPRSQIAEECQLGLEFSGVCRSNGQRVMCLVPCRGISSLIEVDSKSTVIFPVPDEWSLDEAATVPVVYFTVYYALYIRGKMKRGDSILIHSGSGGVGQAAIRVCLAAGCRLFITVGSQEKRDYLMKLFPGQLTADCFASSRTLAFERHVMRATKGRGVDMVLNSLAGDKLIASLRCLAPGGRFLELGKYDMVVNTQYEPNELLDAGKSFHGILVDAVVESFGDKDPVQTGVMQEMQRLITDGILKGVVRPLDRTVFPAKEAEQAFRFLTTGKHTGKVLLELRYDSLKTAGRLSLPAVPRAYFDPDMVYIILGGLGGFGLELAHWMVHRGARKLVLNGRSGITTAYQRYAVTWMKNLGVNLEVSTKNAADMEGARGLLDDAQRLGCIGGIFNSSLVLKDGLFENQTVEQFKEVAAPKVAASLNLDRLTREADLDLEYFVCFSSIACGRGNAGQTNYGWANSAMERLCEERRARGLHGLAIQWGPIGDVGFVAEQLALQDGTGRLSQMAEVAGALPQRIPSCMTVLDRLLKSDLAVASSLVPVDRSASGGGAGGLDVVRQITHILGVKDPDSLDPKTTLTDLGLDSLMAVEIKQALERERDISLTQQEIRNLTIGKLREWAASDSAALASKSGNGTTKGGKSGEVLQDKRQKRQKGPEEPLPPIARIPTIWSTQRVINLNDIEVDHKMRRPVFLVPHVECDFTVWKAVIDCLTAAGRPAIWLNWPQEYNNKINTWKDVIGMYVEEILKVLQAGGRGVLDGVSVDLIAYSLSTIYVWDVALELEARGHRIASLVFLDGAPTMKNTYVGMLKDQAAKLREGELERIPTRMILKAASDMAGLSDPVVIQQIYCELESPGLMKATRQERFRYAAKIVQTAADCLASLPVDHVAWALEQWAWRLVVAYQFTDPTQRSGLASSGCHVCLVMAEDGLRKTIKADDPLTGKDDMGLDGLLRCGGGDENAQKTELVVARLPGDHVTFLTSPGNEEVIKKILSHY